VDFHTICLQLIERDTHTVAHGDRIRIGVEYGYSVCDWSREPGWHRVGKRNTVRDRNKDPKFHTERNRIG
jgi:hypothetical protein